MKQKLLACRTEMDLAEDHIYFGGMHLDYRLIAVQADGVRHFSVFIAKDGEKAVADVGGVLFRAMEIYQRIVRGGVTPCTLEEVIADLRYA